MTSSPPLWVLLGNDLVNLDTCPAIEVEDRSLSVVLPNGKLTVTFETPEEATEAFRQIALALHERSRLITPTLNNP